MAAAFNFCCKFDDLDVNPIAGYEKPQATPRVTAFSPEDEKLIYKTADAALGLFIKACILAGARPYSELARITADHVVETPPGMYYLLKARTADGQHGHKTAKKTGKDRRIMLCHEMEIITRRLMLTAPKGSRVPLFRTTRGKAWKRCNCVQRFLELKKKLNLPADQCMHTCRHTFAKRTLSGFYTGKPVTIEVVAGLLGNTPAVCWRHYASWVNEYNDPLWEALGKKRPAKVASREYPHKKNDPTRTFFVGSLKRGVRIAVRTPSRFDGAAGASLHDRPAGLRSFFMSRISFQVQISGTSPYFQLQRFMLAPHVAC